MLSIRSQIRHLILGFACLAGWLLPPVCADEQAVSSRTPPKAKAHGAKNKAEPAAGLTKDEEQQALGFARSQHPELADLLEKLKEGNPKEYGKALQDLHRAQQKLYRLADQNPERYALELGLWKVESRIRLLMAQMVMEGDGAQDDNLKSLLGERRTLKIELLQLDHGRAVERLTNLDRQLEQLLRDPEGDTEKELSKLKQSAGNQAKAAKIKRAKVKAAGKAADQKQKKKAKDKPDSGAKAESAKDEP
jgi:hypothetical protein